MSSQAVHEQAGRLLALLRQLRAQLGDESTGCPRGERKSLPGTFPEPSDRRRVRAPLEITRDSPRSPEIGRAIGDEYELYGGESLFLALQRWRKLTTELHRPRKDSGFDISKAARQPGHQREGRAVPHRHRPPLRRCPTSTTPSSSTCATTTRGCTARCPASASCCGWCGRSLSWSSRSSTGLRWETCSRSPSARPPRSAASSSSTYAPT